VSTVRERERRGREKGKGKKGRREEEGGEAVRRS